MTGSLSIGNYKIIDLGDPINPQDAATKLNVSSSTEIPIIFLTSGTLPTTTSQYVVIYTAPAGKTIINSNGYIPKKG